MELYWVHLGFSQHAKEYPTHNKLSSCKVFFAGICVRDSQNYAVDRDSGATLRWINTEYAELLAIKADELELKWSGFSDV